MESAPTRYVKEIITSNFLLKHFLGEVNKPEQEDLLERYLVMGISRNSRLMHKYSPNNAITASPVTLTTHQVIEEGQPPYMIHIKIWIM